VGVTTVLIFPVKNPSVSPIVITRTKKTIRMIALSIYSLLVYPKVLYIIFFRLVVLFKAISFKKIIMTKICNLTIPEPKNRIELLVTSSSCWIRITGKKMRINKRIAIYHKKAFW